MLSRGFWVNFRICGKIVWKIMAPRTLEHKIGGGGLKNVDVFDEEPGSRRAASILPCLDLGGDYTTRPWTVKGKGSALAKLALDRPAGS